MASKFAAATSIFMATYCCITPASANAFLKKQAPNMLQFINGTSIETRFLEEVKGFVGKGPLDEELHRIRAELMPMWSALPKNQYGRLGSDEVRYALHRFFVQRHGWHIDGLDEPSADASQVGVLSDHVPAFLMELFEQAFGSTGLMLHELALFAATLERVIHDQSVAQLESVYDVLEFSRTTRLDEKEAQRAVEVFMVQMMVGQDRIRERGLGRQEVYLEKMYPGWKDMKSFAHDVRKTVSHFDGSTNPFVADPGMDFQQVGEVVEQVSFRMGRYQDAECRELKDALLEYERGYSGRVPLADFYKVGVERGLYTTEQAGYLQEIGALDTSTGQPLVIVPNYVLNQGNCLLDTGFYTVCCINECDSIMAVFEREIKAPKASPEQIFDVVMQVTTSTVDSVDGVTEKFRQRIYDIARISGGVVPLHGKLFAQWLHWAFPRECPHPSLSGKGAPRTTPAQWAKASNTTAHLQKSEIESFIQQAADDADVRHPSGRSFEWSDEEEIMYLPSETRVKSSSFGSGFLLAAGGMAVAGAAFVASVDLARRSGGLKSCLGKAEKAHLV